MKQATTLTPVHYSVARNIQLGADLYNTAYINFHSTSVLLSGYTADYSTRIVSSGGSTSVTGLGVLSKQVLSLSQPRIKYPVSRAMLLQVL